MKKTLTERAVELEARIVELEGNDARRVELEAELRNRKYQDDCDHILVIVRLHGDGYVDSDVVCDQCKKQIGRYTGWSSKGLAKKFFKRITKR